jgi:DNA-directed RNA polymerase specialized sigma24 family protein
LYTLPSRPREIIYLKYYEEMEYPKIAQLTGIKYQSVVNHVFRALQTLRMAY